ncbi:BolA-like protein [Balamuthia mandrillaris]
MAQEARVRALLEETFAPVHLGIEDQSSGCGAKFSLLVVSSKFADKALLERHRMVNEALQSVMKDIHALSMKTWTPEQWEQKGKPTL